MTHAVMIAPLQPDTRKLLHIPADGAIGVWYGFNLIAWADADGLVHATTENCPPARWTRSVARSALAFASKLDGLEAVK